MDRESGGRSWDPLSTTAHCRTFGSTCRDICEKLGEERRRLPYISDFRGCSLVCATVVSPKSGGTWKCSWRGSGQETVRVRPRTRLSWSDRRSRSRHLRWSKAGRNSLLRKSSVGLAHSMVLLEESGSWDLWRRRKSGMGTGMRGLGRCGRISHRRGMHAKQCSRGTRMWCIACAC